MFKVTLFLTLVAAYFIYTGFVYTVGTAGPLPPMNETAAEGKRLFQKFNCTACHQVYGLGGYLGPELTTIMSDPAKGESYARAILKSGTSRMPDFKLSTTETDQLVAFLTYVDASAITYKIKKK